LQLKNILINSKVINLSEGNKNIFPCYFMKIIGLLILFQFLLFPCFGQVVINEIMYNPSRCSDSYCEWIEIYNPTNNAVNLTGWNIYESSKREFTIITTAIIEPKNYFILAKKPENFSQYWNISCPIAEVSFSLKNSGEIINLTDCFSNTIDSVTYNNTWGADGDRNSLQRINSTQNLSNNPMNWIALPPSPGKPNFYEDITLELLEILTEEKIYANKTTIIFVKILNHGMENATDISVNISINNIYNNSKTVNISGINISEIQFEWTPIHSGNYTIFASLDGQTMNNTISVLPGIQKNTILGICLETEILLYLEYPSLFKIEIENKKEIGDNCERKDNMTVQYNISNSTGGLIKENIFTVEVGCSKTADTGEWTPNQTGNFTLCGRIINATTTFNSTLICKNITVVDSKTIPCNLTIKISAPLIWSVNEKSKYYIFVNDSSGNYPDNQIKITYWIEDYFGNFIKNPYTTASIKTNKNSSRDYTPKLNCGTAAHIIKAEITNTYCKDIAQEDNLAEKMIVVIGGGECEPCPACKKCTSSKEKESAKKTSNLKIDILELTDILARNQEFTTKVKLKNNGNDKLLFEIYSYAYDRKKCITGGWSSNKESISLKKQEEKIIYLKNKIKKDAAPGEYSFRIRTKIDGKTKDLTETILVTSEIIEDLQEINLENNMEKLPELKIWDDEKLRINLSDCEGCKLIIVGPESYTITGRKYRVFKDFGKYYIFAIKNSDVIFNETYSWGEKEIVDDLENTFADKPINQLSNATTNEITGKITEINPDWTKKFLSKIIKSFLPLIKLMENSIQ